MQNCIGCRDFRRLEWRSSRRRRYRTGPDRLALSITPPDHKRYPIINAVRSFLWNDLHRVQFDTRAMRLPCPVTSRSVLEPDGSNLARVVGWLTGPAVGFGPHWPAPETPVALWAEHLRYALPDLAAIGWAWRVVSNPATPAPRLRDGQRRTGPGTVKQKRFRQGPALGFTPMW